jgi:DNA-binding transcriptional LysR family regulator
MAVQGFGWCVLPCALVDEFAAAKSLVQLNVPGWPRAIGIDLLWNKRSPRRCRKLAAAVSAGCADPCD